jgi:hypothetical protein
VRIRTLRIGFFVHAGIGNATQDGELLRREPEHEVLGESRAIPADRPDKHLRLNPVEHCEIGIKYHPLIAKHSDACENHLRRDDGLLHSDAPAPPRSGCILRCQTGTSSPTGTLPIPASRNLTRCLLADSAADLEVTDCDLKMHRNVSHRPERRGLRPGMVGPGYVPHSHTSAFTRS